MTTQTRHRLAIVLGFLALAVGVVLAPLLDHLKVDPTTSAIILGTALPAILAKVNAFIGKDAAASTKARKAFHAFLAACAVAGPAIAWLSPRVHWMSALTASGAVIPMLLAQWSRQAPPPADVLAEVQGAQPAAAIPIGAVQPAAIPIGAVQPAATPTPVTRPETPSAKGQS